nr:MAG TPA: hypothetical protein [Caudoviricetes sp.]
MCLLYHALRYLSRENIKIIKENSENFSALNSR